MVHTVRVKRIYEEAVPEDGRRVLVDRIWPRGMSRERARIDEWRPDVAPSNELRTWFGHRPERWPEFVARYHAQLAENADLDALRDGIAAGPVTLPYSARDTAHNQAVALAAFLER